MVNSMTECLSGPELFTGSCKDGFTRKDEKIMKEMKKFFALLIAVIMVLGMSMSVFAGSITITTDETYEGTDQEYVYDAYKIFDASYDTLSGSNTQAAKNPTYTPGDAQVSYFMATGNPWISTIQSLSTYFTVTAAADGSGYTVVATDAYATADAAKTVAEALKTALTREEDPVTPTGDYAAIEITAGGDKVDVDDGYYLIVGRTAANLALVTTDVTIVEKNEYPHIIKEFTDEDETSEIDSDTDDENTSANDTVQVGDTVSYTLTVTIPSGANQQMVVTDTFTTGLDPVLDGTVVKTTITGLTGATPTVSAPADGKFTVTLTPADVIANAGKTFTIVYEAVVTEDAWKQTEINTGEVKYGNDYTSTTDFVDSVTYNVELDKKANAEDGEDLGGAKFELYRTDADHNLTKAAVTLKALTDAELTAAGITKADKTIYYRVADADDTGTTTTIDMTEKVSDAADAEYKYTKAVIYGLDGDSTYYARETLAPTGFNILTEDFEMVMNDANHVYNIVNNSGSVLPSTGGIGTTIFYVIGAILVIGSGVVLVTRRRMNAN